MTQDESGLVAAIAALPSDAHAAGTMSRRVLEAISGHVSTLPKVSCTAETGCGRTTLLLSHLSPRHIVFAKRSEDGSVAFALESELLRENVVELVEGPTQVMLPQHRFDEPLDFVLLDGPHAYPFPELEYYFLYPHLRPGGLLVVDDIHIPSVKNMFRVLRADEMFELIEVVGQTAFLRRTTAPVFDPLGDGWWLQGYNRHRFEQIQNPSAMRKFAVWTLRAMPQPLSRALLRTRKRLIDRR